MKMRVKALQPLVLIALLYLPPFAAFAQAIPAGPADDAEVNRIMTETHTNGVTVAVIDHGKVVYVHAYCIRNATPD